MDAATQHELHSVADALKSLGDVGVVEQDVFLQALRALDPSWTLPDIRKLLVASGRDTCAAVNCDEFMKWLFDEANQDLPTLARLPSRIEEQAAPTSAAAAPAAPAPRRWMQPAVSVVPELAEHLKVEFITDIEGNWQYICHFVSMSEILYWEGDERGAWGPGELMLRDDGVLVFGGDAVDKGTGDIRVVKTLLSLKQRYWDRVFLILGNRDICKLRLYAELADNEDGGTFEARGGSYWIPDPKPCPDYESYLDMKGLERGHVSTLKWIFDCNMGCQGSTFGGRKHELAVINGKASDMDVVRSYRDCIDPYSSDPWMLDFLKAGQIAAVLGDALFVHGGLYDESLGQVPDRPERDSTMQAWAESLNAWKDEQLRDFEQRPAWRLEDGAHRRGGDRLLDYGVPDGANGTTIIYHNPFRNGNPQFVSEAVEDFLQRSGIWRVFSGHQPHGESPTVVRHVRSNLLMVTADTSYSNTNALKLFNQANNRGDVCTRVALEGPVVHLCGVLRDGSRHECRLHRYRDEDQMPDALVGCQLNDGSWVKTVTADGRLVAALGKRFQISAQVLHPGKACLMLKSEYSHTDERFSVQLQNLSAEWLLMTQRSVQLAPGPEPTGAEATNWLAETEFKREEFDEAETYIFDGHGTLWGIRDRNHKNQTNRRTSAQLERAVVQNINQMIAAGKRVIFATNDSNKSREDFVDRLLQHGIRLCDDSESSRARAKQQVITASFTCAWFLKKANIRRPFVLCSHLGLLAELREAGIEDYIATIHEDGSPREEYLQPITPAIITELVGRAKDVDAIVVGWDQQLTALKIAVAATILKWSREVAANGGGHPMHIIECSSDQGGVLGVTPDDFLPEYDWAHRSIPAVGNGTMCQTICASVGPDVQAIDVGKPSQVLIEALQRPLAEEGYGVDLQKAVMVGDTLATDIELAVRSGMRSLLVLSGVTSREDLENLKDSTRFPTWVAESLANI